MSMVGHATSSSRISHYCSTSGLRERYISGEHGGLRWEPNSAQTSTEPNLVCRYEYSPKKDSQSTTYV